MKISKILLLFISIGFIVFGSVFIANGFQTTTYHITPNSEDKQDQSSTKSSHSNERASKAKHASVPKQKVHKKSDNGSSSVSEKLNTSARSDSSSSTSMSSSSSSDSGSSSGSTNSTPEQKANPKASGSNTNHSSTSNAADSSNQALINVEIKGYDNKNISGSVAFTDGMTAFRALQMLTGSKNIDLDYSGSGSTAYIKSINGQSAGDKSAQSGWIYKVNGKSPNVSAGSFKLQDGDTLAWIYQE